MGDDAHRGPAPARTADHTLVGLDLDLDFPGAVRRIGLRTVRRRTHPAAGCALRCALEPGPRAAMAGRPRLATRLRSEPGVQGADRQHSSGRAKPLKLDFHDPVPRRLRALSQPGVLGTDLIVAFWRRDLRRAMPVSATDGRQRLPDRSKPGKLGFHLSDRAKLRQAEPPAPLSGSPTSAWSSQTGRVLTQRHDRRLLAPRSTATPRTIERPRRSSFDSSPRPPGA